ncbi:MAG: glycerol-3-phosphate dehydrogenase/oxidase [Desulfobacteraceae bacterium]|nr:glycerol-3-phosphate dehydrogenase/oxidase [Desulfobacteraceae bacterium]
MLNKIDTRYDMVVIGGGITGAGIFLRAAAMGVSVLLLEQNDFAWGTSSRSSKMVHGGLRYLKEGRLLLTRDSVKERQRLLSIFPGLVEPLEFIMPVYKGHGPSKPVMGLGLSLYSLLAWEKQHKGLNRTQTEAAIPFVNTHNLTGGFIFGDAQVDDARLVLRLLSQGRDLGGTALNYTKVCSVNRDSKNKVAGVTARDTDTGETVEISAPVVINATGAFAEELHPSPEKGLHIRPLRGSHLVFPGQAIPDRRVISFVHPRDQRPVFAFSWEGCLVLGTTDVDHKQGLTSEPVIQPYEAAYLMEGAAFAMPGLKLDPNTCIASMAGVRPVLSHGGTQASKESRDHVVWEDKGLVTVTGGKLTTFNLIARDALKAAKPYLPSGSQNSDPLADPGMHALESTADPSLAPTDRRRLYGRYGNRATDIIASGHDLSHLGDTATLWAELAYAAEHEQVRHLSDLLLRRTRLGILLPQGAKEYLKAVQTICKPLLPWDDQRWEQEIQQYLTHWNRYYSSPF